MISCQSITIHRSFIGNVRHLVRTFMTQGFPNSSVSSLNEEQIKGKYDIIIAGGGMVGCTLACALGKNSVLQNMKILLLESSPNKKYDLKKEYSNRVVALNQNTKSLMNSLKVWEHVENMRLQPVRNMQVWDACSDALISFTSSDMMGDDIAYIVENDLLLHAVNTELTSPSVKNVQIVYGAKISGYKLTRETSDCNIVKLDNGDTYLCDLLIGADGANSAVRNAMGVQYLSWSYDQMGVVATLYLAEECENTTAWQRWLPQGPIALLPLDSKRSSLVWSTSIDHAKELLSLPEEQFVDSINDALWKEYPRNSAVERTLRWLQSARALPPSARAALRQSRAAFPLGFGHSTRYVAPAVALVGDAAHRVHPLAGQGVNLGFGDVKDLAQLLSDAVYQGLDITHHSWLEKYESVRQRHNVPTQLAVDLLHRLYTWQQPPVLWLRSVGLQLTHAAEPLKKLIMTQAST
ncbi:ubiquinone biosynthesis monooxygenase COQ6, mitochondrial [Plodia interpunctella]|uniref:ubiquinone biosynthesis monooxygenase COQ6, mitochondrial n=1 Tax=Plodia interpunctella TaxID=58824 RepID=UPI0023674F28|nr:ubiquinone biosynthesis monooxygenase COQ6, mitochondrial [Plodia interpunctella]